jgi:hypothetical protein
VIGHVHAYSGCWHFLAMWKAVRRSWLAPVARTEGAL